MRKALNVIMALLAMLSAVVIFIGIASIESENIVAALLMLFGGLASLFLISKFYFKIA